VVSFHASLCRLGGVEGSHPHGSRARAAQAGGQGGEYLRLRDHDQHRGEDMSENILSPDQLRALLTKFKERHGKEYRLTALGYFGSYACNAATPASDVDIVFDTDAPNTFSPFNK
jgi:hypothetical protein